MQPINELKIRIEAETAAELIDIFGEEEAAPYIAEYCNFNQMIGLLLNVESEAGAFSEAIKERISELQQRKKRYDDKAVRARALLQQMLNRAGRRKVELPEATVSISASRPRVILQEDQLNDDWMRIKKEPDKTAIKKALENGETIDGAVLSNGGETITIRRV